MKMKKLKRILSFFLCFIMLFCVAPSQVVNAADTETGDITVIACSDFQNPSGDTAGKLVVENILDAMKSNGVTKADGFFCCGDYSYTFPTTSVSGINALKEAVQDVVTENMVFVQGNHDAATGMNPSGNNDPDSGAYGVFTINEDD